MQHGAPLKSNQNTIQEKKFVVYYIHTRLPGGFDMPEQKQLWRLVVTKVVALLVFAVVSQDVLDDIDFDTFPWLKPVHGLAAIEHDVVHIDKVCG